MRGLVHVESYTAEPRKLSEYHPLMDDRGTSYRIAWVKRGIARLFLGEGEGERPLTERAFVAALSNRELFVARTLLPRARSGEYYLADLIGLEALDRCGRTLGRISAVHDYGGGASLEIASLLVPFTATAVPEVDLEKGRVIVAVPEVVGAR